MTKQELEAVIQKAYVAYYGRPADPLGLDYWLYRFQNSEGELGSLMREFGSSQEAMSLYGSLANATDVIDTLFQQIFNRPADPEGLVYYTLGLQSGEMSLIDIAQRIIDGAREADSLLIESKVQAAQAFTAALDDYTKVSAYAGAEASQIARLWLRSVDASTSSKTTAEVTLPETISQLMLRSTSSQNSGIPIELTPGIDSTEAFVGSTGADLFLGTETSLNAGDRILGGDGVDTLRFTSLAGGGVGLGVVAQDLERLEIDSRGLPLDFNAIGFKGLQEVQLQSPQSATTVRGLKDLKSLVLKQTNHSIDVIPDAESWRGSSDSLLLSLQDSAQSDHFVIQLNSVETITVLSSGSANGTLQGEVELNANSLTTLNLSGPAPLSLAAKVWGTSSHPGRVTGDQHDQSLTLLDDGSQVVLVNLGGGNDRLALSRINEQSRFEGGTGIDIIKLSSSVIAFNSTQFSGFEALEITNGAHVALNPLLNQISSVGVADSLGGAVEGVLSGAQISLHQGGAFSVSNTSGWDGTDTINLRVGSESGSSSVGSLTPSLLSAPGIETAKIVNLQSLNDNAKRLIGVRSDSLQSVTITSASSAPVEFIGGGSRLSSIDASAVSGSLTISATLSTSSGLTLIGGTGQDVLTGGSLNDQISGGPGADRIHGGTGQDTLSGGSGADVFSFGLSDSLLNAPDTITDFEPGEDRLQIASRKAVLFLGSFVGLDEARAAANAAGTGNTAYFVQSSSMLYIVAAANGTASPTDTVIHLPGASVTNVDVFQRYGSTGAGTSVTLSQSGANLAGTLNDDLFESSAEFLIGSTVSGGGGYDSLTITTRPTTESLTSLRLPGTTGGLLEGFSEIRLSSGSESNLRIPDTAGLLVYNTSASDSSAVTLGSGNGQTFLAFGEGANVVTLGGSSQVVITGAGADQIIASSATLTGASINGGEGIDSITLQGVGPFTLSPEQLVRIEQVSMPSGQTLALTPTAEVSVVINAGTGSDATSIRSNVPDKVITVTHSDPSGTLVLDGSSNFRVDTAMTGAVNHRGSGTAEILVGANASVESTGPIHIDASGLSGELTINGLGGVSITNLGSESSSEVRVTEGSGRGNAAIAVNLVQSASPVVITLNPLNEGSVQITADHRGTGSSGLTLQGVGVSSRDIDVTLTNETGDFAFTGSNALRVAATRGEHSIQTGSGNDVLIGSSGDDIFIAGAGADMITSGGGADVIVLSARTDTGIITELSLSGAIPTQGTTLSTTSLDVVSGFSTGMSVKVNITETGEIARNGGTLGSGSNVSTDHDLALIRGTYNEGAHQFTIDPNGLSSLFVYDDNGDISGGLLRGVVLVGYVDIEENDEFDPSEMAFVARDEGSINHVDLNGLSLTVNPLSDTGILTGVGFVSLVPDIGTVMDVRGISVLEGFTSGAQLVMDGLTETGIQATPGSLIGSGANGVYDADYALLRGTYSELALTFVLNETGEDTLFIYDDNGDREGGSFRAIVLIGYVDSDGDDTYTGTLTGLGG